MHCVIKNCVAVDKASMFSVPSKKQDALRKKWIEIIAPFTREGDFETSKRIRVYAQVEQLNTLHRTAYLCQQRLPHFYQEGYLRCYLRNTEAPNESRVRQRVERKRDGKEGSI